MYEHAIKDCKGLRIRVYPSGRKSWLYRYRDRGSGALRRMVLGEYTLGGMGVSNAREEADRQRAITNEHGSALDYRDQKRRENWAALEAQQVAAEGEAYTVSIMVREYLDDASRTLEDCASESPD